MDLRFSVRHSEPAFKKGDVETNRWVVSFLLGSMNPNDDLANTIAAQPLSWTEAMEICISELETVAGPSKPYHVDQEIWDQRVNGIISVFSDRRALPPAIVLAEETAGDRKLIVADGAHRIEALRRMGLKTVWVLVGFSTPERKRAFLTPKESGEPVITSSVNEKTSQPLSGAYRQRL